MVYVKAFICTRSSFAPNVMVHCKIYAILGAITIPIKRALCSFDTANFMVRYPLLFYIVSVAIYSFSISFLGMK